MRTSLRFQHTARCQGESWSTGQKVCCLEAGKAGNKPTLKVSRSGRNWAVYWGCVPSSVRYRTEPKPMRRGRWIEKSVVYDERCECELRLVDEFRWRAILFSLSLPGEFCLRGLWGGIGLGTCRKVVGEKACRLFIEARGNYRRSEFPAAERPDTSE